MCSRVYLLAARTYSLIKHLLMRTMLRIMNEINRWNGNFIIAATVTIGAHLLRTHTVVVFTS